MNLTGKQIRAARVLAGWDRPVLAEKAGFSLMTIQNIELETKRPKQKTIDKIISAFRDIGIEFTDNEGVRRRPTGLKTYEGTEAFNEFYDFLYETIKREGGEICICGSSAVEFAKHRRNPQLHRDRMAVLVKERKDIRVRTLAEAGDQYMPSKAYTTYRWLPKEYFSSTTFYAFGEYYALISFAHNPPPMVVCIHSKNMADDYRKSFNALWDRAALSPLEEGAS